MGDQNVGFARQGHHFGGLALQIANDTSHYILDVEGALAQIRIIDLPESFGVPRRDVMKDRFDVKVIAFQFAQDLVDQSAIFHHQEMGIENSRIFRPDCLRNLLLHFENLNARLHQRRFEAGDLGRDLRRRN